MIREKLTTKEIAALARGIGRNYNDSTMVNGWAVPHDDFTIEGEVLDPDNCSRGLILGAGKRPDYDYAVACLRLSILLALETDPDWCDLTACS